MSNILSCHSIGKAFGAQTLFRNIQLVIAAGDRIGLIGPNGSGKSTLLKIICGLEEQDEGDIQMAKHASFGYLAQTETIHDSLTIQDNLFHAVIDSCHDEAEAHVKVQTILSRAGFENPLESAGVLSGGWRKRLGLCMALIVAPDVLVLDEPTNHLDLEGILWLEQLICSGFPGSPSAYLVVSHDRRFLETTCTRMIELSAVYPEGSFQVNGSYSDFLRKRCEFLGQQMEAEDRLANKVRRETEWLQRGPKARTSKARYRIDEAYKLQDELAQVKGRNRAHGQVRIDFGATGRKTKKLLTATGLGKAYGDRALFENVDVDLAPGTRLGLLGHNGCGKSTLMQILSGAVLPDSGEVQLADGLKIANFEQRRDSLNLQASLRRALAPEGDSVIFQGRSVHVVSWAKRFLFRPDQLETPVGELSGGEQARILIASLMRQPADILLLDEPTNDLDIDSLDVLEESLMQFPGAVVLVTHDRYLLDRVCGQVLGFDGKGKALYYADYEQWLSDMADSPRKDDAVAQKPKAKGSEKRSRNRAGRLSYMDQREYDQMEDRILEAETRQEELEAEMAGAEVANDPEKLQVCWTELEAVKEKIAALYERWSELEDKMQDEG